MFTPTSGMNCGHGHAHQRATRTPALAPQPPTRGGPCQSHHYTGKLRQRRPAATATPTPCRRTTPDTRAARDGAPATFWTSRPELIRHLQDPHIATAGPVTLWTPACQYMQGICRGIGPAFSRQHAESGLFTMASASPCSLIPQRHRSALCVHLPSAVVCAAANADGRA